MKQEELYDFLIAGTATVVEAMQKIDLNTKGILFVTDEEEKLAGVITDGDIRRWLIRTGNLQEEIWRIMNQNYLLERKKQSAGIYRKICNHCPAGGDHRIPDH